MIKKEKRLRKKKDIENVFKNGKSFYADIIGIKLFKNDLDINRYCVVISANISKKAVDRNKIRRRIKAVILESEPFLKTGIDCLIITKKEILNSDFLFIKKALQDVFKKTGFCL